MQQAVAEGGALFEAQTGVTREVAEIMVPRHESYVVVKTPLSDQSIREARFQSAAKQPRTKLSRAIPVPLEYF